MQTSPPVTEIKKWLHRHNPLGCFATEDFEITDIDPRAWSGHFNYLITTRDKRFVLRSKGPEWGESTQGIFDEYRILKALEPYDIAPKVFYLSEDFFGEGMLFQEYMEGTIITTLPRNERLSAMMDAVRYIASINITPVTPGELPHGELLTSYAPSKREWRERIDYAMKHPPTHALAERIATLLPKAESMLDQFEDHLTHVLAQIHPAFVFISSHAGHCLKRASDYRFFNWEQVSFGDPSYSLAVFLASIKNEPDFEQIKNTLVDTYLEKNMVPDFRELIDQRLAEREIADLTWSLWSHANRKDMRPAEDTGTMHRFEAAHRLLEQII